MASRRAVRSLWYSSPSTISLAPSFAEKRCLARDISSCERLFFNCWRCSSEIRSTFISVRVHSLSKFSKVVREDLPADFLVMMFSRVASSEINCEYISCLRLNSFSLRALACSVSSRRCSRLISIFRMMKDVNMVMNVPTKSPATPMMEPTTCPSACGSRMVASIKSLLNNESNIICL